MRFLIADISPNGKAEHGDVGAAQVLSATDALASEVVANVDPQFLSQDEIARGLPERASCRFSYTASSLVVLAIEREAAVMKISGDLVRLDPQPGTPGVTRIADGPLNAEIREGSALSDMIVTAGADYSASFRGQFTCGEGG